MTQPNAITTIQQTDMETCDDDMVFTALIKKDTKICNDLKIEYNNVSFLYRVKFELETFIYGCPKNGYSSCTITRKSFKSRKMKVIYYQL